MTSGFSNEVQKEDLDSPSPSVQSFSLAGNFDSGVSLGRMASTDSVDVNNDNKNFKINENLVQNWQKLDFEERKLVLNEQAVYIMFKIYQMFQLLQFFMNFFRTFFIGNLLKFTMLC